MKVSIVIPTRNNASRIVATLRCLFRQTISPSLYEIIVVDNGSTDNTEEILSELEKTESSNLRWVKELEVGRARARNRGILESLGELVLFLDDDIEVESDHLASHLACHAQSYGPVAVIGRIIDISPITPACLEDYFHTKQVAGSPVENTVNSGIPQGLYFATGNVSLFRSTLESIRKINRAGESFYFDPTFTVREDGDMGCRLIKEDVHFIFAEHIICRHYHPRSWRSIASRTYDGGYALLQLIEKHPEVQLSNLKNVTGSFLLNLGLALACLALFFPAFLMRKISPQLLRKVIGALLAYQTNRGFRRALTDRLKSP